MQTLTRIKPIYLYLLSGIFFILSRYGTENSLIKYSLIIVGIIFFITAIVKYFRN